jgi:hypothetical protein
MPGVGGISVKYPGNNQGEGMTARLLSTAFAMACCLSLPAAALAKSGHGGGHSSGGHGSGHASGGHASGGHASGHGSGSGSGGHGSNNGSAGQSRAGAGTAPNGAPADRGASSVHETTAAAAGARPRDREPVIGTAVSRTGGPFVAPRFFFSPYRAGGYYPVPIGFGGLGLYYDPFLYGYGYGFGGFGYPDYMYGYEAGSAYPSDLTVAGNQSRPPTDSGNLRLLIEPPDAQVYVDGSFVGTVEDVGSALAGLRIDRGPHRIELRAPGYETLTVDVSIEANRTITYRGELRRIPPR